jgi:hypothetical protein
VVTRPGTGGFESVKRKRSDGDLEGSARMERSMVSCRHTWASPSSCFESAKGPRALVKMERAPHTQHA